MEKIYVEQLAKIEQELERWLPESYSSGSHWMEAVFPGVSSDKISDKSMQALLTPGKDIISRGGKRWRPLLMVLICDGLSGAAGSGKVDSALPLTPLVEFSHNATLVHDDIEDDSDERRGKPAVHKIYGVDTAINSGSFLYFLSLACIERYNGENKPLIYKLWGQYMRALHLGQAMDISWHKDVSFIPNIEEYFAMCGLKTGSLARLAAEIGTHIAGASKETAQKLSDAANKLGVGFQILDDVKNLSTGISGKIHGDDIVEGKKSLPILLCLTRYPQKREFIYNCFNAAKTRGATIPEVQELIQLLTDTGILAEAESKGYALIKDAREIFSINVNNNALLDGFINLIS